MTQRCLYLFISDFNKNIKYFSFSFLIWTMTDLIPSSPSVYPKYLMLLLISLFSWFTFPIPFLGSQTELIRNTPLFPVAFPRKRSDLNWLQGDTSDPRKRKTFHTHSSRLATSFKAHFNLFWKFFSFIFNILHSVPINCRIINWSNCTQKYEKHTKMLFLHFQQVQELLWDHQAPSSSSCPKTQRSASLTDVFTCAGLRWLCKISTNPNWLQPWRV